MPYEPPPRSKAEIESEERIVAAAEAVRARIVEVFMSNVYTHLTVTTAPGPYEEPYATIHEPSVEVVDKLAAILQSVGNKPELTGWGRDPRWLTVYPRPDQRPPAFNQWRPGLDAPAGPLAPPLGYRHQGWRGMKV